MKLVKEQLNIARQCAKPISRESCHNSSEDEALCKALADAKHSIQLLQYKLEKHVPPFCEKCFVSNEFTQFYIGLPNIKVVKTVFKLGLFLILCQLKELQGFQLFKNLCIIYCNLKLILHLKICLTILVCPHQQCL